MRVWLRNGYTHFWRITPTLWEYALLTYYSHVPIPMIAYYKTYRLSEVLWLQSLQLWTVLQFPCWLFDWMYFRHINTDSNINWFKLEIVRCRYHIWHILKSKLNVLFGYLYQFVQLVSFDEINSSFLSKHSHERANLFCIVTEYTNIIWRSC